MFRRDECHGCGESILDHDPPIIVKLVIGTLPESGVDYEAEELEGECCEFIVKALRTSPGISAAMLQYGASCFAERFSAEPIEVERLQESRFVDEEEEAEKLRRGIIAEERL